MRSWQADSPFFVQVSFVFYKLLRYKILALMIKWRKPEQIYQRSSIPGKLNAVLDGGAERLMPAKEELREAIDSGGVAWKSAPCVKACWWDLITPGGGCLGLQSNIAELETICMIASERSCETVLLNQINPIIRTGQNIKITKEVVLKLPCASLEMSSLIARKIFNSIVMQPHLIDDFTEMKLPTIHRILSIKYFWLT